ncbi:hypothetical protein GCM10028777_03080 [Angustibacter speluncae]
MVVALATAVGVLVLLHLGRDEPGLGPQELPRAPVLALTSMQALVLAVRRTRPLACLAVVVACQLALTALVPPDASVRLAAPAVAAYTLGTLLPGRASAWAVATAVLAEAGGSVLLRATDGVDPWLPELADGGAALLVYGGGALVGGYVGTRRRYVVLLRRRAEDLQDAQRARVRAAISAERTRMARELHDIAAHHLSGVVVQAAAVERLIGRDPQAALEGTRWIRSQGRATLEDLRLLVGVLREPPGSDAAGGADDPGAPVPGLDVLHELVDVARGLGAEVDLDVPATPLGLPPVADVALYRVAQEALSNARQHAPGAPVRVRLSRDDDRVELVVENGAPRTAAPDVAAGGGAGLVGMRERTQLVGATLATGPTADGGWRVRAVLPHRDDDAGGRR